VEVSTKQCTPRLPDFEALAEEDFVHCWLSAMKFLTIFLSAIHFIGCYSASVWFFVLPEAF